MRMEDPHDDAWEQRLHEDPVSPVPSGEGSVGSEHASLTDSHRDPIPEPGNRPIISDDGAEHFRRVWQRSALLVPLEIQYRQREHCNRSVASKLAHRRKRSDKLSWPEYRAGLLDELVEPHRAAARAMLVKVDECNRRRLTPNDNALIRRTGSWRDPSRQAVLAIFSRLLVRELTADGTVDRDYAQLVVDALQYQCRYSGYWAVLARHLEALDRPQRDEFWRWHRDFPRPN